MLNCHIVKDLLPNYIDGLVSKQTEQDIQQHLQSCCDCQSLYDQMKVPIEATSLQSNDKEINFLKKIKMKTLRVKIAAGVLAVALIVCGVLAWIFAIGTPVSSEDILITTEIQHPGYDIYLGKEWVIHFNLTNGKAIIPRREMVTSTNAYGNRITTGCIIKLYEVQATNWMYEADNYTWGYSVQGDEAPTTDFTVTVRLKDKDIVYSVTEEGLFEPQ